MYMSNLTKANEGFENMKNVRSKIQSGFTIIHAKLKLLRKIYSEVVSKHKKIECTLGVDALFFQSELIDKEYNNLQALFQFINNRIYCEYYKLFYYIKDYVTTNLETDVVEDIKMDSDFPAYKSLDTSIVYDFGDVIKMQSHIINTLDKLDTYFNENVTTNNKEKDLLKMGLHIDTVIHTQDYINSVLMVKLKMFYQYLETFNTHHYKHLNRLLTKTEMIVSIINDDMPLHETSKKEHSHAESEKASSAEEQVDTPTEEQVDTPTEEQVDTPIEEQVDTPTEEKNTKEVSEVHSPGVQENFSVEDINNKLDNSEIQKNVLDTSGDLTKFAKSVVDAENINFIVDK